MKLGVFPPHIPIMDSQPSFFRATIAVVRSRLAQNDSSSYTTSWSRVFRGFESSFALQHILASLFNCLTIPKSNTDDSPSTRALVKREGWLLSRVCPLKSDDAELWQSVSAAMIGREWKESFSRVFVCWVAECDSSRKGSIFVSLFILIWSDPLQLLVFCWTTRSLSGLIQITSSIL